MGLPTKKLAASAILLAIVSIATLFWLCPLSFMPTKIAMYKPSFSCEKNIAPTVGMGGDSSCFTYHSSLAATLRTISPNLPANLLGAVFVFLLSVVWLIGIVIWKRQWQQILLHTYQRWRDLVGLLVTNEKQKLIRWFTRQTRGDIALLV